MSDYSPLETLIRKQIKANGPMPVSRYMQICLTHPQYGYYLKRDPLGREGDFITAPEISQVFGELMGLALAGMGLTVFGVWLARKHALAGLVDEPTRIQFEYGPRLIAVQDSDMLIAEDTVEVANFSDLARLAEREERMILYERCGPIHHYVVQIAGTRYHYRVVEASMAAREVRP